MNRRDFFGGILGAALSPLAIAQHSYVRLGWKFAPCPGVMYSFEDHTSWIHAYDDAYMLPIDRIHIYEPHPKN